MAINTISNYINHQVPKDVAIHSLTEILNKIKKKDHLIKKIMQVDLEPLSKDPYLLNRLIEKKPHEKRALCQAIEEIFNACKEQGCIELIYKLEPAIETFWLNISDKLPKELMDHILFYVDDLKTPSLISKKWYAASLNPVFWTRIAKELGLSPPRSVDVRKYVTGYIKRLNKVVKGDKIPDCLKNPTSLTKIKLQQLWKKANDRYLFWRYFEEKQFQVEFGEEVLEFLSKELDLIYERLNRDSARNCVEVEKNLKHCEELFSSICGDFCLENFSICRLPEGMMHLQREFSNLCLHELDIMGTSFWEFPVDILEQTVLFTLRMDGSSIKELSFDQLPALWDLEIDYDPCMKTDLEKIFDIEGLRNLKLVGNGDLEVSSSIKKLKNLMHLELEVNTKHFSKSIGELTHLQTLKINTADPYIPKNFKKLKKLVRFKLYGTNWLDQYYSGEFFQGKHIDELIELQTARDTLHVWEKLAKKIGLEEFPQVANYKTVDKTLTEAKKFTVWVQQNIAELQKLLQLDLSNLHLTSIPDELGQLENLSMLNLAQNHLRDVPDCVFELKHLTSLNLGNNQLEDLSDSVKKLQNLKVLELQENYLTELPEELGKLIHLVTLHLSDNRLKALPNGLSLLGNLRDLYLKNNQLSELPEGLKKLPINLYTSGNPLSKARKRTFGSDQVPGQPPIKKSKHNL